MKKNTTFSFRSIVLFLCTISVLFLACSKSSEDEMEVINQEEEEQVDNNCSTGYLYHEKDGLVRVDIENPSPIPNGWDTANTFAGFEGDGYLIWTGEDNFNTPGMGTMAFSIEITNPGTYQFVWRSRIGAGDSNTEHNDSWLRIPTAADFYGEKASTGERVYPKGTGKTPNPEGSSKDGWLKVYMNRLDEWFWRSTTNDRDPFNIFAQFDTAGTYNIEISGRSKAHALDQFVLFRTGKTLSEATVAELSEITCK